MIKKIPLHPWNCPPLAQSCHKNTLSPNTPSVYAEQISFGSANFIFWQFHFTIKSIPAVNLGLIVFGPCSCDDERTATCQ